MYEKFDSVEGMRPDFSRLSDVKSIDLENPDIGLRIGIKEWLLLLLGCVLSSAFGPLMICLPQPSFFKLF